jgi:chromosome segregation ATPase
MISSIKTPAMFTRTICLVVALYLSACSGPREKETQQPEPPKALQENKTEYSIKSARSSGDLVQELYEELTEKDSALKQLENQLKNLQRTEDDSTSTFTGFDGKNKNYHSTAGTYLPRISDSLIRDRIRTILANSLSRYEASTAAHQQLLKQIADNKTALSDLRIAVQLVRTLGMMEKYQQENMPAKAMLLGYIQQQEKARKMAGQQIQ